MRGRAVALLALLAVALTACERRRAAAPPDTATFDTTDTAALDGLSREQLRQRAQPMRPEEAARRGLIDTTIHVEDLTSEDTLVPRRPPRPDTGR